jgi:hypothetical protein
MQPIEGCRCGRDCDQLVYADKCNLLKVAGVVEVVTKLFMLIYFQVAGIVERVASQPNIKEWVETRPNTLV